MLQAVRHDKDPHDRIVASGSEALSIAEQRRILDYWTPERKQGAQPMPMPEPRVGDSVEDIPSEPYAPGYTRNPRYEQRRREFVERCISVAGLKPSDHVLDVGCGVGGVASFLADYLDGGRYVGLDVDPKSIERCRLTVGARRPDFEFAVIDVWNKKYNPLGTIQPTEYRFPFPDGSFDLITLRSVFTHMLPDGIDDYLAEVARVLRVGGHAAITYFLLNDLSRKHLLEPAGAEKFPFDHGVYRLRREDLPEAAVAIDEGWMSERCDAHGLRLSGEIEYGGWDGRPSATPGGQDLVITQKG